MTSPSCVSCRYEDVLVDVTEILKERSQRYRIGSSIFEDDTDEKHFYEVCPEESADDAGVFKLVENSQGIIFQRSGVDVFELSCAGKIFDEAKLHLNLCESKPDHLINHPLFLISRSELHEIIQIGGLKQRMKKQVICNNINKYLFFLMSCHCSEVLVHSSCDTLLYHLLTNSSKTNTSRPLWKPSIDDIMLVFSNYGASRDLLASCETPLPQRVCSNQMTEDPPPNPMIMNITSVLKLISSLLVHHRSTLYTTSELDHLLCMILTVSLDKHIVKIKTPFLHEEFGKCIKSILKAYPSAWWKKPGKVSKLSRILYNKLRNVCISDVYFIIQRYIQYPGGFGKRLALSLALAFITGTVKNNKAVTHMDNVEVKHIAKIFKVDSLLELDYFTQYYVILMLESAVIYFIQISENTRLLNEMRQLLSNLRIKSPHSEDMLDYLLVKQLITRAATIWKLSAEEVT